MQVVTPLDLIMQPNFAFDDSICIMDIIIGKHGYDPKQKTQLVDGTLGRSFQDFIFDIILSKGLRKRYYSLSAKLDYLFSLTKNFSLKKFMEPMSSTENDIVARAIAWEERKEWEQWHP